MESDVSTNPAAGMHDLELESVPVGPHTRMILLEADDQGNVDYLAGKRHRRRIALTRAHARMPFLMIDGGRWALMLEPRTLRLEAMVFFFGTACRTVLMGAHWGDWIDEHGGEVRAISIPELLLRWGVPVLLNEERQTLGVDFPINIYNRDAFTKAALLSFKDDKLRHNLELHFGYPLGGFRQGRLRLEDERTEWVAGCVELEGFPLVVPARPAPLPDPPPKPHVEPPKPEAEPRKPESPQAAQAKPESPFIFKATHQKASSAHASPHVPLHAHIPPHPPHAPAPPKPVAPAEPPLPRTEHLPLNEMLTVLATEKNPDRRWKMLEANLALGRPERTYPLIARYPELIGEHAVHWAPARLKAAFSTQPGAVLIGIMETWAVNQVLAAAETSSEPDRIMQWLREREIERLLKLDLDKPPVSAEHARGVLGVDKHADEAMVKKVWRMLLAFMNADHGRSEERAIHRRKDEIAKHLQMARNVLLQHL